MTTPPTPASAAPNGRVLVTGATGALGPATVRALTTAGHRVRVLVRTPAAAVAAGIEPCIGDLTDRASLDRATRDADAVVHLAALLHVVHPPPGMRAEYHRVNVDGTRALAEAAAQAGVRRFVFASTAAVYGPTPVPAVETTPAAPDSWYGESKVAAEATLLEAHRPGTFDVTILRLSAVYGPRIKGNYQRLLHTLAAGRFVPIGAGTNRRSLLHEDDAAAAFALAAVHRAAPGLVFNVSDGTPHELRQIIAAMCRALGRPDPRVAIPSGPAIAAARLAGWLCGLAGDPPPRAAATLAKYLEESVVDTSRIAQHLGFAARIDLLTGWHTTVRELRAAGALPPGGAR